MSKDKNFSDLMRKPDINEQSEVWFQLMKMAKIFEEEIGYSRQTVLEGILQGMLDLAIRRQDERLMQKLNDTRRFYLLASETTKRRFDQFTSYKTQRRLEKLYGKDMLYMRDARNFGWVPENENEQ